jgi:hypothetical protein
MELNERARTDRLTGTDPGRSVALQDGTFASRGDVIVTRHNDRRLVVSDTDWVKNGDRWHVTKVHADGSLNVYRVGARRLGVRLPAAYVAERFKLGYAATVHSAQGMTVDTTHAADGGRARTARPSAPRSPRHRERARGCRARHRANGRVPRPSRRSTPPSPPGSARSRPVRQPAGSGRCTPRPPRACEASSRQGPSAFRGSEWTPSDEAAWEEVQTQYRRARPPYADTSAHGVHQVCPWQ